MTSIEINKAIAEYCKWKPTTDGGVCWDADGNKIISYPSFDTDLNLMHKAELSLWNDECLVEKYVKNLRNEYLHEVGYQGCSYWFMAGASIRARAFLKTVGKWKY